MIPVRKNSKMAGLPPGTLIQPHMESGLEVKITRIVYDEIHAQKSVMTSIEDCFPITNKQGVTWVNIDGVHDIRMLERLGELMSIHILILEDILDTEQRPKLEILDRYTFLTLKALDYDENEGRLDVEQLSIITGPGYVITFEEKPDTIFENVMQRIQNNEGRVRKMGAGYLVYVLLDAIVDNYFVILERVGEKTELLEDALLANPSPEVLQKIHNLKRDMIVLRRSVWPLREIVNNLSREDSPFFGKDIQVFIRDLYDHTIHIIDTIETFRDIVSGMLDIYLSSVSNRMNEVMKMLTIIATIFIPLTLVTGIYGMNFQYMPELSWRWGYPMVWAVLVLVSGAMLLYFKRRKWL